MSEYFIFGSYFLILVGVVVYSYLNHRALRQENRELREQLIEVTLSKDVHDYNAVRKGRTPKQKEQTPFKEEPEFVPEVDADDATFQKMLDNFKDNG